MNFRIALLCNMNNNNYCLTRYLRDNGFDARLLQLDSDPTHFGPESDSYENGYKSYCHKVEWGYPFPNMTRGSRQAKLDLQDFSFLIASGTGPAYINRIGRTVDIFIPFGEDLLTFPYRRLARPENFWGRQQLRHHQRRAIQSSRYVLLDHFDYTYDRLLQNLRPRGRRIFAPPPMVYLPEYSPESLALHRPKSRFFDDYRQIRDQCDLMLFHHSRHVWKPIRGAAAINIKGNDIVLRGLQLFRQRVPSAKVKLVTFEYGSDVAASKSLISELGLEKNVHWLPTAARKDIMLGLSIADAGIGQVSWGAITYGVAVEVLASGVPFIGRRDASPNLADLYPMHDVKDPDGIAKAFFDIYSDRRSAMEMGLKGKEWLERRFSDSLNAVKNAINEAIVDSQR